MKNPPEKKAVDTRLAGASCPYYYLYLAHFEATSLTLSLTRQISGG